ncbi:MAG: hypothetical protein KGJ94_05420 [Xanthomonadaceae bacterium]|nr:hypothetical protein [Xanthomonadaceae bacterium]
MYATSRLARWFFAAAFVALGITGIVNGDFALVWQHVPAHVPGRTTLAYVCAAIEIALGLGLLFERTRRPASRILLAYLMLWLVLLQVPHPVRAPADASSWGSIGEIAIMTAGAWCLAATGADGVRGARWLLVVALPMIGVEVIVDAHKFGAHVMQPWLQWLPWPAAWAAAAGIASIAACLALLFGVWPRLAAAMEAAMLGLITVAYWGPDLSTGRTATTAFIISALIAIGAWLVAGTYRGLPWFATWRPVWKT